MKTTPSSSKQFQADRIGLDEQAAAVEATGPAELLQGGSSRASASILAPSIPKLNSSSISGSAEHTTIRLLFNTAMTTGAGSIYVTDGFAQTVIDRSTGLPTMRIVGDTHTREIALSSLHFSGNEVIIDADGLKPGHGYSVFMTAGALASVTHQAFAGIRTADRAHFNAPPASSTDTTAPTLVGITFDSDMLKVGHDIKVTVKFSEKVATPDLAAFTTPNAALAEFYTAQEQRVHFETTDGGITWHALLHASDLGKDVAANMVTVDMARIFDLAGNAGAGSRTSSDSYAVDTIVGTAVGQMIVLRDDAGPYDGDYITYGDLQLIEGTINGALGGGQHFELRINGTVVAAGITLTEVPGGFTWSYAGEIAGGTNTVTARIVNDDASHSSAAVSQVITIDNADPILVTGGSMNTDAANPIVLAFNEKMAWGPGEGADLLIVEDVDGHETAVAISRDSLSADGRMLAIPAGLLALGTGGDYTIYVPFTLTDLAGNNFQGLHVRTNGVDITPPRAVSATVDHSGSYGLGAEIEIRVVFSEQVTRAGEAVPALALNNHAVATFVRIDGTNEMVFKYIVGPGQDVGNLDILDNSLLIGAVADLSGNLLGAGHIRYTRLANADPELPDSGIKIDATPPIAPVITGLAVGSDTHTPGDGITAITRPTLKGEGAEPNTRVELYEGGTRIGAGNSDAFGKWTVAPDTPLLNGTHTLAVKQVDAAGNPSPASGVFNVTIDSTAPAALAAVPALASDSGSSSSDRITSDPTPAFTGSGAEAGARIDMYEGSTQVGTATADGSGTWTLTTTTALANGAHTLTVRQVDTAGNASVTSPGGTVTIDTNAPGVLAAPTLAASSDSGVSNSDRLTSDTTPTFTGSAEPNATIKLYLNGTRVDETTADGSGVWSYTFGTLTGGTYSITAKQEDVAGNDSEISAATTITIDTTAPVASWSGSPMLPGGTLVLTFDERITPGSMGTLTIRDGLGGVLTALSPSDLNWRVVLDDGGHEHSVLEVAGLPLGSYTLHIEPVDLVGLAAPAIDHAFTVALPA